MYRAILFAPDGEWVSDYPSSSIDEIKKQLENQGSRWIFYPIHGIIRVKSKNFISTTNRIVEMATPLENLKGRAIKTASKYIKDNYKEIEGWFDWYGEGIA